MHRPTPGPMTRIKHFLLPVMVAAAVCTLVGWAAGNPWLSRSTPTLSAAPAASFAAGLQSPLEHIEQYFQNSWQQHKVAPTTVADDLQVLRRLSLALFGTIPSLEEIRRFESDRQPDRVHRWTIQMLLDDRFNDYFAERLAVAFIGDRQNDMPIFRRERFQVWLSDQIKIGRGYDDIVRDAITATGQVTVYCSTNFVTAEMSQGDEYANRLAGRVARAFLGQRIDCAECHDHPFAAWKQADFQGMAAFFAQLRYSGAGISDNSHRQHEVEDRHTLTKQVISPRVPFDETLLGTGGRRQQLATWVTHPNNRRFPRAIANRIWGLMFGRPLLTPVDDLPDPPQAESDEADLLDILADDFASHGYDLRRLALVITSSRPFRLSSTYPSVSSTSDYHTLAESWAAFPLVQLRTEQIGRSMQQLQLVSTLCWDSDPLRHTYRTHWLREFSEQYGILGELELDEQSSSVQQTIVRMTGRFTQQTIRPDFRHATTRIASLPVDDSACVEACFLVCLSRYPTPEEQSHFVNQLKGTNRNERQRIVEDTFWSMLNSSEFAWNH